MPGRGREKGIGRAEASRYPSITKYLAAKTEPAMSVEAGVVSQRAVRAAQRQLAAMEESAIPITTSKSVGNIRTELVEATEVSPPITPWTRATTETQVCSVIMGETIALADGGEQDIRKLIQALPTKVELQALLSDLKAAVREEMSEVTAKLEVMDKRLCSCESLQSSADARIELLERKFKTQHQKLLMLQLQAEESENRSRRNNVRIKGVPEIIKTPDLRKTVTDIFNKYLGKSSETHIELDRVHRSPVGLTAEKGPPRDVLCRVHFFGVKEDIMRAAWQKGALEYAGQKVQVFPDLSWQTKRRRRLLRPLLDQIRVKGATYRWGHPLSLIIKKDGHTFALMVPEQLPDLFKFLGSEVVEVPDWIDISIDNVGEYTQQKKLQRSRNWEKEAE